MQEKGQQERGKCTTIDRTWPVAAETLTIQQAFLVDALRAFSDNM